MRAKPPPSKPSRPQRPANVNIKKSKGECRTRSNTKTPDISILMKSIDTRISSVDQVIKLFENATPEVINFISKECTLIFECKICKNLFRSLANFLSHKRGFCEGKFDELFSNHQHFDQMWYQNCQNSKALSSRSTTRKDILSLIGKMKDATKEQTVPQHVILKDLPTTNEALFNVRYITQDPEQEKRRTATVEPCFDLPEDLPSSDAIDSSHCSLCDREFPSQKALKLHTKTDHGHLRICFVCPCCKKYFANAWSVYRHMYKVHRKTNEQVRKLRPQIQKKQISLEELIRAKKNEKNFKDEDEKEDEKVCMDELKGHNSLHTCASCGKKFERKVALISHSQQCKPGNDVGASSFLRSLKRKALLPTKLSPDGKKRRLDETKDVTSVDDEKIIVNSNVCLKNCTVVLNKADIRGSPYLSLRNNVLTRSPRSDDEVKSVVQRYNKITVGNELKGNQFEELLNRLHQQVALENCDSFENESETSEFNDVSEIIDNEVICYSDDDLNGNLDGSSKDSQMVSSSDEGSDEESSGEEGSSEEESDEEVEADEEDVEAEAEESEGDGEEVENVNSTRKEVLPAEKKHLPEVYPEENIEEHRVTRASLRNRLIATEALVESRSQTQSADEKLETSQQNMEAEALSQVSSSNVSVNGEENESVTEEGVIYDTEAEDENPESKLNHHENKERANAGCSVNVVSSISASSSPASVSTSVETEKEFIYDCTSDEVTPKYSLFPQSNVGKEDTTAEKDEDGETMESYVETNNQIGLYNNFENVCLSNFNTDELPERETEKEFKKESSCSPKVNGRAWSSRSGSSTSSVLAEEDRETLVQRGDWLNRKINSFMSSQKKKCLLCLKTFHKINFVRRHIALHFNVNKFRCLINSCNYQSYLRCDINHHLMRVHKKKEFHPFVGRLYPKEEDFDQTLYNPDPKPVYAGEKNYKVMPIHCQDSVEKSTSECRVDLKSDRADIDRVESITRNGVTMCKIQKRERQRSLDEYEELETSDLSDLALTSQEKLNALMMQVIFGGEASGVIHITSQSSG